MFHHMSVPLLPSLLARTTHRGTRPTLSAPFRIGLAVALAASAGLAAPSPSNAYEPEGELATAASIQYQEATAHATESFSFTP